MRRPRAPASRTSAHAPDPRLVARSRPPPPRAESETTSAAPGKSVSRLQTTRATAEALSKDPAHADELAELKRLDDQVCQLRRKHDELAHANMEKRQELKRTENKLHDINKESVKGGANADPRQRELRELERKLQEAVVRYEDAYDTRRTCDQIMKRLTEERIGYDNTIAELDNRLKAKELECARPADHGAAPRPPPAPARTAPDT